MLAIDSLRSVIPRILVVDDIEDNQEILRECL